MEGWDELVVVGAMAFKQQLGEQLDATPLPVPEHVRGDDWSAEGGSIDLTDLADAMLRALHAAGVRFVPVEATMDMGLAGAVEIDKQMTGTAGPPADYDASKGAWKAMLAATPYQPPEG